MSRSLSDVYKVSGWPFGSLWFLESTVWENWSFICTTATKCEVCHSLGVVVRHGTGKCRLRVGKYTWWLKTYIPGNVLLEKLTRTAGEIKDNVPSRCSLRWDDAYLNGSQGMQSQSVSDSPSRFCDGSPYSTGPPVWQGQDQTPPLSWAFLALGSLEQGCYALALPPI